MFKINAIFYINTLLLKNAPLILTFSFVTRNLKCKMDVFTNNIADSWGIFKKL